jgi:hypothetical protein
VIAPPSAGNDLQNQMGSSWQAPSALNNTPTFGREVFAWVNMGTLGGSGTGCTIDVTGAATVSRYSEIAVDVDASVLAVGSNAAVSGATDPSFDVTAPVVFIFSDERGAVLSPVPDGAFPAFTTGGSVAPAPASTTGGGGGATGVGVGGGGGVVLINGV